MKGKTFFKGYNPDVNTSIFAAFAMAAFRFGHSLVQEEFQRFTQRRFEHKYSNNLKGQFLPNPMKDFDNPFYLYEKCAGGIDSFQRTGKRSGGWVRLQTFMRSIVQEASTVSGK